MTNSHKHKVRRTRTPNGPVSLFDDAYNARGWGREAKDVSKKRNAFWFCEYYQPAPLTDISEYNFFARHIICKDLRRFRKYYHLYDDWNKLSYPTIPGSSIHRLKMAIYPDVHEHIGGVFRFGDKEYMKMPMPEKVPVLNPNRPDIFKLMLHERTEAVREWCVYKSRNYSTEWDIHKECRSIWIDKKRREIGTLVDPEDDVEWDTVVIGSYKKAPKTPTEIIDGPLEYVGDDSYNGDVIDYEEAFGGSGYQEYTHPEAIKRYNRRTTEFTYEFPEDLELYFQLDDLRLEIDRLHESPKVRCFIILDEWRNGAREYRNFEHSRFISEMMKASSCDFTHVDQSNSFIMGPSLDFSAHTEEQPVFQPTDSFWMKPIFNNMIPIVKKKPVENCMLKTEPGWIKNRGFARSLMLPVNQPDAPNELSSFMDRTQERQEIDNLIGGEVIQLMVTPGVTGNEVPLIASELDGYEKPLLDEHLEYIDMDTVYREPVFEEEHDGCLNYFFLKIIEYIIFMFVFLVLLIAYSIVNSVNYCTGIMSSPTRWLLGIIVQIAIFWRFEGVFYYEVARRFIVDKIAKIKDFYNSLMINVRYELFRNNLRQMAEGPLEIYRIVALMLFFYYNSFYWNLFCIIFLPFVIRTYMKSNFLEVIVWNTTPTSLPYICRIVKEDPGLFATLFLLWIMVTWRSKDVTEKARMCNVFLALLVLAIASLMGNAAIVIVVFVIFLSVPNVTRREGGKKKNPFTKKGSKQLTGFCCSEADCIPGGNKKKPFGFRWFTWGDGLCGIHAANCLLRNFNYQALMFLDIEKPELKIHENVLEYFVKPNIQKFIGLFREALDPEEYALLERYVRTNQRPQHLTVETINFYCDFLGCNTEMIINTKSAKLFPNEFCNERNIDNMSDLRDQYPPFFITLTGAHFEASTLEPLKTDVYNIGDAWEKMLADKTNFKRVVDAFNQHKPTEEELMNMYEQADRDSIESIKNKPNPDLSLEVPEEKKEEAEAQPDKTYKDRKEVIKDNKEIKNEHTSYVNWDEKLKKFVWQYGTNLKMGKTFSKVTDSLKINYSDVSIRYAHPSLRIISDYYSVRMICDALNSAKTVIEHAAKPHKTLSWLQDTVGVIMKKYFYTRPIILKTVDNIYHVDHKVDQQNPHLLLKIRDVLEKHKFGAHILSDVGYYDDTLEAFRLADIGTLVFIGIGRYSDKVGRHYYFDEEGYYDIFKDGTMRNVPKMNGAGYEHKRLPLPEGNFTVKFDTTFMNYYLVESVNTSADSSYCYYRCSITTEPEFDIHELFPKHNVVPDIFIEVTDEDVINQTMNEEKEVSRVVDLQTGRRSIHPDWAFYRYMDIESYPKMDHLRSNLDQYNYKLSEYKKTDAYRLVEHRDDSIYIETFLYLIQEKQRQFRLLTAGFKTPRMFDVFRDQILLCFRLVWFIRLFDAIAKVVTFVFAHYDVPVGDLFAVYRENFCKMPMYFGIHHVLIQYIRTNFELVFSSRLTCFDSLLQYRSKYLELFRSQRGGRIEEDFTKVKHILKEQQDWGNPANDYYDDLDPIREQHYEQKNSKKFYHAVGNRSLKITHEGRTPKCTCKHHSYEKIIQMDTPVHFGSCELNMDACFKARAFNTHFEPDLEECVKFRHFVHNVWFKRNKAKMEEYIWNGLTDDDFSFEKFLNDTAKEKRTKYKNGILNVQDTAKKIDWRYEFFVKPNELHFEKVHDVRPRLIANPSDEVKAMGAYLARLMIKVMKHVEPGFISGYSLDDLSAKVERDMEEGKWRSTNVYSYDGSSHDAHQSWPLMETVDCMLLKFLIPLLLARSACIIPLWRKTELIANATNLKKKFYNVLGQKGFVYATVFSGDPFSTTLFNTMRTILYNRYAAWVIDPIVELLSVFWAAGDDVLCELIKAVNKFIILRILGGVRAKSGLGQNPKDFKIGPFEDHTFLSKEFIVEGADVAFMPVTNRLYKSGTSYNIKSAISKSEHRLSQIVASGYLPKSIASLVDRFKDGFLSSSKRFFKYLERMRFDWSYKTRMDCKSFKPRLEMKAYQKTDKHILFKIARDSRDKNTTLFDNDIDKQSGGRTTDTLAVGTTAEINMEYVKKDEVNKKPVRKRAPIKRKRVKNRAKKRTGAEKKQKKVNSPHWLNKHHDAETAYAKGLFVPEMKICRRIPGNSLVPTAVSSIQGEVTANLNATGFGWFGLFPHWQSLIWRDVTSALSDTVGIAFNSSTLVANPINSTLVSRFRVVSASLMASDLTPVLNKTGRVVFGSISVNQLKGGNATSDTIRDSYYSRSYTNNAVSGYKKSVYLPSDPTGFNFTPIATEPADWNVPFAYYSGCTPNATISLKYCVNFEYIPTAGNTDLLTTEVPPIGSIDSAMGKAAQMSKTIDLDDIMRGMNFIDGLGKLKIGGKEPKTRKTIMI